MADLHPSPFRDLVTRMFLERARQQTIFDLPLLRSGQRHLRKSSGLFLYGGTGVRFQRIVSLPPRIDPARQWTDACDTALV
ncbi:MAG: hypothetical protein ABSG14_15750 [Verrucomicrobiia bacterium]